MTSPTSSRQTDHAPDTGRVRIDRWLWAARFFRSRALAKAAIEGGKVLVLPADTGSGAPDLGESRGVRPKPGREIAPGEQLLVRRGELVQVVVVLAVETRRGNATAAARLFEETPESVEAREAGKARRQLERAGLQIPAARPDKRERRERRSLKLGSDVDARFADPAASEEAP